MSKLDDKFNDGLEEIKTCFVVAQAMAKNSFKISQQRDNLLAVCENDLKGFMSICKTCASVLPRPCKCKWQKRIDEIESTIAKCKE